MAGNLLVQNNCKFDIWCSAAKNDGSSRDSVRVPAGNHYTSPLPANNDNIGSVLKCTDTSGSKKVFQEELAVQNGRSWFDLSAIDGDPFINYHRHAEISGQCVLDCPTTQDAVMTLC
ncbi:uncharacterized protein F4812DRAFT_441020 [Daldinia caldariorum]|uniref:uncharacterized protein n=1 Tax=Daldinia caldariorum TaxID=326644 RepID=UPI0020079D54|nr:uncharacterized protein F4812DRAFT_441020 [Daldinia caldariorum]KAI1464935.1 hypothetical protein F4812DRAFT_441020 [Daldinia caldariorum]